MTSRGGRLFRPGLPETESIGILVLVVIVALGLEPVTLSLVLKLLPKLVKLRLGI